MQIESENEAELPKEWEVRADPEGRIYYANHESKYTQWEHPITKKIERLHGELPFGWERQILTNGDLIFIDKINKKISYLDPRLGKAKSKYAEKIFQFKVDNTTTALQLLKNVDLSEKIALVTGGNRGVGYEIARSLAISGCHVILACRTQSSGDLACEQLKKENSFVNVDSIELDLSSLKSVKNFVDKFLKNNCSKLHMLFLNACTFETEFKRSNETNVELMFQVNHLAQFYLTRLLLDILIDTPKARIIVISSESHRASNLNKKDISEKKLNVDAHSFDCFQQYCNTKLCNILFSYELNRRLVKVSSDVRCHSAHPGNLLSTDLFKKWLPMRAFLMLTKFFTKNMQQAAATPILPSILTEDRLKEGGLYWNHLTQCQPSQEANDAILAYRLWEISESILIKETSNFDTYLANGDKFSSITSLSLPIK